MASNGREFDVYTDSANTGGRWQKWLARFTNMMVAMDVQSRARQKALLLHYAGEQVFEIFETLPDTSDASDDFEKACEKLTTYFSPKKNMEYEVYQFRKQKQEIGESLDTYHTHLRRLAATCEFADTDREIKGNRNNKTFLQRLRCILWVITLHSPISYYKIRFYTRKTELEASTCQFPRKL